jgi:ubiquitin-small subunit ribosomal protein S27Ae
MAAAKDAKKSEGPAVKLHPTTKRQENYEKGKQKNKFCPKCGPGVMMADHKDRTYCGKCHYTEKK